MISAPATMKCNISCEARSATALLYLLLLATCSACGRDAVPRSNPAVVEEPAVKPVAEQVEAVRALRDAGLAVILNDQGEAYAVGPPVAAAQPGDATSDAWGNSTGITDDLLQYLPDLPTLSLLTLNSSQVTDEGMTPLRRLPRLHSLAINSSSVTDAGLAEVAQVSSLRVLYLRVPAATSAGLSDVARLFHLKHLVLAKMQFTGGGFQNLRSLPDLRILAIIAESLTDEDLAAVAQIEQLENLHIQSAQHVTDAGIRHIAGLRGLHALTISACPNVGDGGFERIAELPQLVRLTIRGDIRQGTARFTDDGMRHLESLESLRVLSLSNTEVSDDAVKRLKKALPNCLVQHHAQLR